jgi:hypothetical protein
MAQPALKKGRKTGAKVSCERKQRFRLTGGLNLGKLCSAKIRDIPGFGRLQPAS